MDFLQRATQAQIELQKKINQPAPSSELLGLPAGIAAFVTWLIWHNLTRGLDGFREDHSLGPYVVIFILIFGFGFNTQYKSHAENLKREVELHNEWIEELAVSEKFEESTERFKVYYSG